jgi:hypothetical protein
MDSNNNEGTLRHKTKRPKIGLCLFWQTRMKRLVLYLVLTYFMSCKNEIFSQPNLIFNPSFEELIDTCQITGQPFITFEKYGWFSFSTADLFHSCIPVGSFYSVPNNIWGIQNPATGDNYAGISIYEIMLSSGDTYQEYITGQITQALKIGRKYCSSINVSLADTINISCHNMGIAFTNQIPVNFFGQQLFNIIPQISNNSFTNPLSNKINWLKIRGSFVSNGSENYITIGNFLSLSQSDTSILENPPIPSWQNVITSYYYIDDVSLYELKALHNRDTLVCPQSNFSQLLKAYSDYDSYLWNTGDTTKDITINQPGTYWVTASNWCGTVTDTITVSVFDTLSVQNPLGADFGLCQEQFPGTISILPQYQSSLFNFSWSTGSDSVSATIPKEGVYYLTASHLCGSIVDSIQVNLYPAPQINLGNDTTLCVGQSIVLDAGENTNFFWNTGDTIRNILVSNNGTYFVTVTNTFNCIKTESISINFEQESANILPLDTTIFVSQLPISIRANNGFNNLEWSNGSNSQSIEIYQEGIYYLKAIDSNGCVVYDTISVSVKELSLIIPSIISQGQAFFISNLPPNSNLKIFNALGQLIYINSNYQNNFVPIIATAIYYVELNYTDNKKEKTYRGKLLVE